MQPFAAYKNTAVTN